MMTMPVSPVVMAVPKTGMCCEKVCRRGFCSVPVGFRSVGSVRCSMRGGPKRLHDCRPGSWS